MREKVRVGVLYNVDFEHYPPGSPSYESDAAVRDTAEAVARSLAERGADVQLLTVDGDLDGLGAQLRERDLDVVFNLVESVGGDAAREPDVPALLESLGIAYTGNRAPVLRVAQAKDRARELLAAHGLPVPRGLKVGASLVGPVRRDRSEEQVAALVTEACAALAAGGVSFPVFVKPARTDASIGVDQASVCRDEGALARKLGSLSAEVDGPYLIEEYLPGREINVAIFPEPAAGHLVCTDLDFSGFGAEQAPIVTYDCKWRPGTPDYNAQSRPSKGRLPDAEVEAARSLARAAFLAIGGTSYGRVDLRAGASGQLYVIDVNPNPDIHPEAGLSIAAASDGVDHPALVTSIVEAALARRRREGTMEPRPITPGDREPLAVLLSRVDNFSEDERAVAMELIDLSITEGPRSGYETIVIEDAGRVLGYLCFGLTPMTDWTYDLYWVAVDPDARGRGLGKRLVRRLEELARERGGRIIRIETSSMETYGGTLEFYLTSGYVVVSRIVDFYRAGDDLITLVKHLDAR